MVVKAQIVVFSTHFYWVKGGEFSRYQNWHSQVFIKYIELSSGYMLFDLKVHQILFLRSILTIHHSKIKFYTLLCYAIVPKNLKKVVVRIDFLNKNSTLCWKPKIVTLCLQKQFKVIKRVEWTTFTNVKLCN
jgi:hypothetical protein